MISCMKSMKGIFMLVIYLSSITSFAQTQYNNFIKKNGEWIKTDMHVYGDSACQVLGYTQEMFRRQSGRHGESHIESIYRKLFSGDIIVVTTMSDVDIITDNNINLYGAKYDQKSENRAINTEDILQRGIEKRTLTLPFLCEVMDIPYSNFETDNVTLTSTKYKYILTFEKGILVNYKPSDGLGKWARYLQEGQYFSKMEKYAKNYWGTNQDKIIGELNTQSDAWSKIPSLFQNNYCYLFSENNGEVCNAKIMNITLYGDTSITENEFKDITHNKAKFDGILTYYGKRCRRYSYMDYYFLFEEDGTFYKVVEK